MNNKQDSFNEQNQQNIIQNTFNYNQLVFLGEEASAKNDDQQPQEVERHHISFIDDSHRKVSCQDCKREINKTASILSSEKFRCVGCFAKLEQPHTSYTVIKSLNFPLVNINWKANHQILFLSYIERFGFGNWKQIKEEMEYFGAKYSEQQLENHYYTHYLSTQDCMPKFLNNESFFQKKNESNNMSRLNHSSIASLPTTNRDQNHNYHYEEIEEFYQNNIDVTDQKFISYYNCKRNEFQIEYDNDAELLLAVLEFRDDDCEEEKRLKYQLLDEYNKRLEKRYQVKQFVLEHRLLQDDYQQKMNESRNQYQRQAFNKLKPIARFFDRNQFNKMVQKVAFTKQLKSTIEGLRNLRRSHPSSYKTLDDFLNSQPSESKPKKKIHSDNIKTGKKVQEVLSKQFKIDKRDIEIIYQKIQQNGKIGVYKNVEGVLIQKHLN